MQYILDFDHTLFNSSAFAAVVTQDGLHQADYMTPSIWDRYNVDDFLYPDVIPWLQSKSKQDLHILTAMTPEYGPQATAYQKHKLANSAVADLVNGITFMVGDKGSFVQEIATSEAVMFVDDKLSHHISVRQHAPHVRCVQIKRPGVTVEQTNQSDIMVVQGLDELDTLT